MTPSAREIPQTYTAFTACPRCRCPVTLGANRVRMGVPARAVRIDATESDTA